MLKVQKPNKVVIKTITKIITEVTLIPIVKEWTDKLKVALNNKGALDS
jgi:hypothetical protein